MTQVTKKMYIGTATTVLGTLVAVLFSSSTVQDLDVGGLFRCWLSPAYIVYLIAMGGGLVLIPVVYKGIEVTEEKKGRPEKYGHVVKPCLYATWSALFGTQSVVQAKVSGTISSCYFIRYFLIRSLQVLAELLALETEDINIWADWFFWATLILWLFTVGVWLHRLNDALSKFDPLFIIPVLQCNFIFFAIVSGGIFFGEFAAFGGWQWVGFITGVSTMFAGLGLLTPTPEEPSGRATRVGSNLGNIDRDTSYASNHYSIDSDLDMPEYRHPAPSLYR